MWSPEFAFGYHAGTHGRTAGSTRCRDVPHPNTVEIAIPGLPNLNQPQGTEDASGTSELHVRPGDDHA